MLDVNSREANKYVTCYLRSRRSNLSQLVRAWGPKRLVHFYW